MKIMWTEGESHPELLQRSGCFIILKHPDVHHLSVSGDFTELARLTRSVQFNSVTQSCPTLCDPMNCSTPGLPVHHHLQEFTQTHVHRVHDATQPSDPLSSPSPPALNPSQHQSLFQGVNSSHEVAKVLELTLASVLPKNTQD